MEWRLGEIHDLTGGDLRGSPDTVIRGFRSLEEAEADQLSFVRDPGFFEAAHRSRAGALLVPPGEDWQRPVIEVESPDLALVRLLGHVTERQLPREPGVQPGAWVAPDAEVDPTAMVEPGAIIRTGARIGARSAIGAGTVVGARVEIGSDCVLHGNVTLYHDVILHDRVIIHSGSVIGADGFGYIQHEGAHIKIPHAGSVIIESDVEIGALTTIDRGMLDPSIVHAGVKIDDHCHIAHNCRIGEGTLIAGGCQIAGSVTIGRGVLLAGHAGVSDNISIGDGAVLGAACVALKNVAAGEQVLGYPAGEGRQMLKAWAAFPRLPDLISRVRALEKRLD